MDVHDEPENPQGPVPEDVDMNEAWPDEEEAEVANKEEGQGRYWLFNLLELLTPMPDDDEEDQELNELDCPPTNEAEEHGENASG
jgi:hypothetical protein